MRKKVLSLALALVMCLGLTVPAFAVASDWKLEVPGKTDAEVFVGGKTFIFRDWNFEPLEPLDPTYGEIVTHNLYIDNVCVLAKGDTAVFAHKPEESTNHGGIGFGGAAGGTTLFSLEAWSDPDGDGVYDRRMIRENYDYEDDYSDEGNRDCELALGNGYEVLPVGTDVDFWEMIRDYWTRWDTGGEDLVRLSADRVLELFGPNTLVTIRKGTVSVGPAGGDWYILVEGNTTQPTVSTVGGFTDVKTGDYFAEPVKWAVEKNITAGTSATTFSPNQDCTVAQILTFLWRANGSPKPSGSNPFTDIKSDDYYAEAAVWAYEKGMVSGSTFGGNTPCTRSMAVTYMWKAAGSPNAGKSGFTDVPANANYAGAVAWAVEQGVTAGTSASTFSPDNVCTRGQIVTFLYRGLAK